MMCGLPRLPHGLFQKNSRGPAGRRPSIVAQDYRGSVDLRSPTNRRRETAR